LVQLKLCLSALLQLQGQLELPQLKQTLAWQLLQLVGSLMLQASWWLCLLIVLLLLGKCTPLQQDRTPGERGKPPPHHT
jgi:hypothetical protein